MKWYLQTAPPAVGHRVGGRHRGQGSAGGCRGGWALGACEDGGCGSSGDRHVSGSEDREGDGGWLAGWSYQVGSGAVQGAAGTGWACVICVRPQGHACWFWLVPRPRFGHTFPHSPRIVRWTWESVAHTSAPRCTSWDLSPAPRVRGQTHQEHVPVSGWVSWLTVREAPHPGQLRALSSPTPRHHAP